MVEYDLGTPHSPLVQPAMKIHSFLHLFCNIFSNSNYRALNGTDQQEVIWKGLLVNRDNIPSLVS